MRFSQEPEDQTRLGQVSMPLSDAPAAYSCQNDSVTTVSALGSALHHSRS